MALLTGMTPDGQEVPVQVNPSGQLVAEGLPGPTGPTGPTGPAGPAGPAGDSQWNKNGADINYSGGRVGIGTTTVDAKLHVSGGNIKQQLAAATNGGLSINNGTDDVVAIGTGGFAANGGSVTDGGIRAANSLVFATGSATPERARIDSSGRLLVGTNTAPAGTIAADVVTKGGLCLQSPDGSWFRITVSDSGALSASKLALAKHQA